MFSEEKGIIYEPLAKYGRRRKHALAQTGKPVPPGIFKQLGKIFGRLVNFARGSYVALNMKCSTSIMFQIYLT